MSFWTPAARTARVPLSYEVCEPPNVAAHNCTHNSELTSKVSTTGTESRVLAMADGPQGSSPSLEGPLEDGEQLDGVTSDDDTPSAVQGPRSQRPLHVDRRLSFIQGDLGPPLEDSHALRAVLANVYSWTEFDVFELQSISHGRALYALAMAVFTEEGLLDGWKVDRATFDLYMRAVQQGYRPHNPYHNAVHAADVTQAVAVMMRNLQLAGWMLSPMEKFSLLLAAVVHDLAHPGLTNDFLINTSHRTALLYNDRSVNENYHVSCAFRLAHEEHFNIFRGFTQQEYKDVCVDVPHNVKGMGGLLQIRRMVIGSVLMTDMTQHFQLLESFNRKRKQEPDINKWETKDVLLQLILHTADISNPFRMLRLGTLWGELVTQEFLQQGKKERELGMLVTPTCDRDVVVVSTSQLRFAKWFVKPLMEEFRYVSSDFSNMALELLAEVEQYWSRHEQMWREGQVDPHKRLPPLGEG